MVKRLQLLFLLSLVAILSAFSMHTRMQSDDNMDNIAKCEVLEKSASSNFGKISFNLILESEKNVKIRIWQCGCEKSDESFYAYDITVNKSKLANGLAPQKGGWSFLECPNSVALRKGNNVVDITFDAPAIPDVEFVEIAEESFLNEKCSATPYDEYVLAIKREDRLKSLPSLPTDTIGSGTSLPYLPDLDIPYSYNHANINWFGYTFYTTIYCSSGQELVLNTEASDCFEHFIEVFNADEPSKYSWSCKSDKDGCCSFKQQISQAGVYYVRLRSYKNMSCGLCSLSVNGIKKYVDVPVCSSGVVSDFLGGIDIYNIFTANSTGDPMISILKGGVDNGTVFDYNDDYATQGDFDWELNSRIKRKLSKSQNISRVIVSSASSYNPNGSCELYMGCKNSTIPANDNDNYFYFLKEDDAIMAAPATNTYNCIAWSGGRASSWDWPSDPSSQYASDDFDYSLGITDMDAFDRYYADKRYPGCTRYRRVNYTGYEGIGIDFWGYEPREGNIIARHASIKGNIDKHHHGYAWESKCGALERIFHPRKAVKGYAYQYGDIIFHYTPFEMEKSQYTAEEAVADNNSVYANAELSSVQEYTIEHAISEINSKLICKFDKLYSEWQKVWDNTLQSNPYVIKDCNEYRELEQLCRSNDALKYKVFDKINRGIQSACILFNDLFLIKNEQNQKIMSEIRQSNWENQYDDQGRKIINTIISNQKNLLKYLLHDEDKMLSPSLSGINNAICEECKFSVSSHYSKAFIIVSLKGNAIVSIDILDLNGNCIDTVYNGIPNTSGEYEFISNIDLKGTCLIRFIQNGKILIKKLIL